MASQPRSAQAAAAQQNAPEEEKQVDYGDQFDLRGGTSAGRVNAAQNQTSGGAQAAQMIETTEDGGVARTNTLNLNVGQAISLVDDSADGVLHHIPVKT